MTTRLPAQCFACTRLRRDDAGAMLDGTCEAYPREIPFDILGLGTDHREPFGGEAGGLVFEQADTDDAREAFADWQAWQGAPAE